MVARTPLSAQKQQTKCGFAYLNHLTNRAPSMPTPHGCSTNPDSRSSIRPKTAHLHQTHSLAQSSRNTVPHGRSQLRTVVRARAASMGRHAIRIPRQRPMGSKPWRELQSIQTAARPIRQRHRRQDGTRPGRLRLRMRDQKRQGRRFAVRTDEHRGLSGTHACFRGH